MNNYLHFIYIVHLSFRNDIRNKKTNTLWMYSKAPLKEVMLEDILKECKEGDKIIFLTEDKRYSLPHNEIELVFGC